MTAATQGQAALQYEIDRIREARGIEPLSMSMFATSKDYAAAVEAQSKRRAVSVRSGDCIEAGGIRYRYVRRHRDIGYLECVQLTGHPALIGTVQAVLAKTAKATSKAGAA